MEQDDEDLATLMAWRAGDRSAGVRLVRRHFRRVSAFFRAKVASPEDAAELVSETFVGFTRAKDDFRGETSFRHYVYTIALNVLRHYIRKSLKRHHETVDFATFCVKDMAPSSMSSILARHRESQLMVLALQRIPLDFQVCLELSILEGLTGSEISQLLSVPEGTVRSRLRIGKAKLREQLAELEKKHAALRSTRTDIEGWARKIREALDRVDLDES